MNQPFIVQYSENVRCNESKRSITCDYFCHIYTVCKILNVVKTLFNNN